MTAETGSALEDAAVVQPERRGLWASPLPVLEPEKWGEAWGGRPQRSEWSGQCWLRSAWQCCSGFHRELVAAAAEGAGLAEGEAAPATARPHLPLPGHEWRSDAMGRPLAECAPWDCSLLGP